MGEAKRRADIAVREAVEALAVDTMGGRVQVRWNARRAATPFGQLAFFLEFLNLTGLYGRWEEACPLHYAGPNASRTQDIIGTWFLSVLAGHQRYAHIASLRGDVLSAQLLGLRTLVSEDTVRRALIALEEQAARAWMQTHLDASVWPLLSAPWILDVDVTIKPLYGKQEGAAVGYNPKKPGRPSHAYHTYQMAGLRLMLGVEVAPGNQSHSNTSLPGLIKLLEGLPADKRPRLVRGDAGAGGEPTMAGLEERGQPYLFKQRLTHNVKRHIERAFACGAWHDAGQGWQGQDGEIQLLGWRKTRRIVVLRRPLIGETLLCESAQQLQLAFVEKERPVKGYEYAVLVTDLKHELGMIAQLYRDRGDAENSFDEMKRQWGWTGFTTQDLKRCQLSAMAVALVYNWWSLFVRLAHPKARLEAVTARPLLLGSIGELTHHAGQTHLAITPVHAKAGFAKELLTRVSRRLNQWKRAAEQLNAPSVWQQVCEFIVTAVTGINWLAQAPPPHLTHCATS